MNKQRTLSDLLPCKINSADPNLICSTNPKPRDPHFEKFINDIDKAGEVSTERQTNIDLKHPNAGVIHTPLTRAVMHLLKIGSTHRSELEMMSEQFITAGAAAAKLGITLEEVAEILEKRNASQKG